MGKVILLGAGCGSYELMSERGKRLLQHADCILYDRLIDPMLFTFIKPHCECIDVGKKDHHHTMPQQRIEQLMIEKAAEYELVIRLKGGDPYVFGRGGEEGLALAAAKIPFEVVPGISSCIAALAYAGIPITQRGITIGFRVYSAHAQGDICPDLDFESMAKSEDTLVFLMGLRHCQEISLQLLQHGMAAETPVAFISHGATNQQQTIVKTLVQAAHESISLTSPCIIVVGKVVTLRSQLNVFEQRPLMGKRILFPKLHHDIQAAYLLERGADVKEVQCGHLTALKGALDTMDIGQFQYLIFTSQFGIYCFMKQLLSSGQDVRALHAITIVCIGAKSAQALGDYGLHADILCTQSDSKHLAKELKAILHRDDHILLAKARNHNTYLQEALKEYDLQVCELYENRPWVITLEETAYDAVLFTSAFQVHACMPQIKTWKAYQNIKMFSIGPQTSEALRSYDIIKLYEAKQADKQQLMELAERTLRTCIEAED